MNNFECGKRVILTDNNYCPTKHCPVWGSSYMCIGTILTTASVMANIQWDNGVVSSHFFKSLTLHNGEKVVDPNRAFLLKKLEAK